MTRRGIFEPSFAFLAASLIGYAVGFYVLWRLSPHVFPYTKKELDLIYWPIIPVVLASGVFTFMFIFTFTFFIKVVYRYYILLESLGIKENQLYFKNGSLGIWLSDDETNGGWRLIKDFAIHRKNI
jgi:hypothetical protein